jgi:4-hydroxy-tetrahydrodipicolinate synthase
MKDVALFAAVGTPLTADETLDRAALEMHVVDQFRGGMTGVLIGGTMGLMQLLTDATYRQLVEVGARAAAGRGEVMVGVGDTSLARTRERVRFVNEQRGIDGVVCLSPFLVKFSQEELVDYFIALGDESRVPLYLYDLPVLTGVKLSLETVLAVAKHPNIRGIKCSTELGWSRQLADLAPRDFRVIFAQADLVDVLLRAGVTQHLDGVFALAPDWTAGIARAAAAGDWARAAAMQQKMSALLRALKEFGVFPSFTALLNARGIPGNYCPAPLRQLDEARRERLLASPIVAELLAGDGTVVPAPRHDNGNGAVATADPLVLRSAAAAAAASR